MEMQTQSRWMRPLLWGAAILWTGILLAGSLLSKPVISELLALAEANFPASDLLTSWGLSLPGLINHGCMSAGFAVLAWLLWIAMRYSGLPRRASWWCSLMASVLMATVCELAQMPVPGRMPLIFDWLFSSGGALAAMLVVAVYFPLNRALPKLFCREVISYVVCGVLTTILNIVVFDRAYAMLKPTALPSVAVTVITNSIAWVIAVLFAFAVNKLFVFQSRAEKTAAWKEFVLFIAARLFSLAVDLIGMVILINLLGVNETIAKVAMNVIVMIMNYFFSKWFIFKPKVDEPEPEELPL